MDLHSDHYFQGALERMEQARALYGQGADFALCMYVAGVAVECMLRAFITRRSAEFEGRHDIARLYRASGIWRVDPAAMRANRPSEARIDEYKIELDAAIQVVHRLWHNNYRYASEERLRSHLRHMGAQEGIKGDFLKENARS